MLVEEPIGLKQGKVKYKMKRQTYLLVGVAILIILGSFFLISYQEYKASIKQGREQVLLSNTIDPDIVLINLEEGDRSFIGKLLLKIDSCKPFLIGLDGWFKGEKDSIQDSVLMKALEVVQNDILGYVFDSTDVPMKLNPKFGSLVKDQGSLLVEGPEGFSNFFTPIQTIYNENHEHFSLKVIKHWKPNFKVNFKTNEFIPIKFTRTLNQFVHFNGSELTANNCKDLKNKVVLLGYLGPGDEDKHFTPLRSVGRYDADEPDTYGLVIVANEIRTILDY